MVYFRDIDISKIDKNNIVKSRKKGLFSDNIYCFDIEVTSLFNINGRFKPFDYSLDNDYYRNVEKRALSYIWQFGINDIVIYGRELKEFYEVLKEISDTNVNKIIYCHNLSYEFQFLLNIIKQNNLHLENVLSRGARKVIEFTIIELNITFRCSYALTNLSLAKCAIQYNCEHKKQVGELDYNKARSPLTILTENELKYCEYDIIVMHEFLQYFKKQYKHIYAIPITQTGEVRRDINSRVDYFYHQKIWDLTELNIHIFELLMLAFQGGITHANYKHANKIINDVVSYDYASSYPFRMLIEKFPNSRFFKILPSEIDIYKDRCCLMFHVKLHNFKSRLLNHYIPSSKGLELKHCRFDNGRVIKGEMIELVITDIDLEIIRESYSIEQIEYIEVYASYKRSLPKIIKEIILEYYNNKTKLKGIDEELYMKSKQKLNSMFGCAVSSPFKRNDYIDLYNFDGRLWKKIPYNDKFLNEKISEMKKSYSTLFSYAQGVWVTAYARKALWDIIKQMDCDICYYDTDSVKFINHDKNTHIIDEINKINIGRIKEVCKNEDLDYSMFEPIDTKGNKHLIGMLEYEGEYKQFKTLGAKKYCYVDDDNMHITISGVPKKAVNQLNNDINNFEVGFIFNNTTKLNLIYNDEQKPFIFRDIDSNIYTCTDIEYSIVTQPTTYELGITDEYEKLIEYIQEIYF